MKCECYRLLAALYNPKLNPRSSEVDKRAMKVASDSLSTTVASIVAGLKDGDMQKAKRTREILKTAERILEFAKANGLSMPDSDDLSAAVTELDNHVDSQGVKLSIQKVDSLFDALKDGAMDVDTKKADEDDSDDDEAAADAGGHTKSRKKKKKKQKKKKRR